MAIINSIAIGKASGKLGNIIYQSYKGKTISRSHNNSISTEPSQSQLLNQSRLLNAGRAYSYLATKCPNYNQYKKYKISFSAWFTHETHKYMTNYRAMRGYLCIRQLAGISIGEPDMIRLTSIELLKNANVKVGVLINFEYVNPNYIPGQTINIICSRVWHSHYGVWFYEDRIFALELTESDFEQKQIVISVPNFDNTFVIAYNTHDKGFSGNILFSNEFD